MIYDVLYAISDAFGFQYSSHHDFSRSTILPATPTIISIHLSHPFSSSYWPVLHAPSAASVAYPATPEEKLSGRTLWRQYREFTGFTASSHILVSTMCCFQYRIWFCICDAQRRGMVARTLCRIERQLQRLERHSYSSIVLQCTIETLNPNFQH